MLDRTIPFYNTILKCNEYGINPVKLPNGYKIVSYQQGFEKDWSRLECAIGDFESEEDAADYFCDRYLTTNRRDDLLFLQESSGNVIGSCIAWTDDRNGIPVHSLHWLIVDDNFQGKGLGRALCISAMNRYYLQDRKPVYIHTQPWSWKAILLYTTLGFRLQKSDSFGTYTNQYEGAICTLRQILSEEIINKLEENAEE